MGELVAMEPGTVNSGIYADKPGYHGTRAQNDARAGVAQDYSCKATLDRQGPSDKAAGYDWTFKSAQAGDYRQMAKIGDRLEAAFVARDPRLRGWREALGQTDTDKAPEGLDFQGWYRRVPDSTHEWHFHLSELRAFVESYINKQAMLSVLRGETLAAYLARGGRLIGMEGETMSVLVRKKGELKVWLADGILRRWVESPTELAAIQAAGKAGRLSIASGGAIVDVVDLDAYGQDIAELGTAPDLDALAVKLAALLKLPTTEEIAAAIGRQDAAGLRAAANMVDAPPA
jgi:hypothetical protein